MFYCKIGDDNKASRALFEKYVEQLELSIKTILYSVFTVD